MLLLPNSHLEIIFENFYNAAQKQIVDLNQISAHIEADVAVGDSSIVVIKESVSEHIRMDTTVEDLHSKKQTVFRKKTEL